MAIAVKGAVIIEQNGTSVKYVNKCDKCGYVHPGSNNIDVGTGSSTSITSYFTCYECGQSQQVLITGGS